MNLVFATSSSDPHTKVSLNRRENATLHLTHMSNVIHTVNTFSQELKALLRKAPSLNTTLALCISLPFCLNDLLT